jgi:hypothetical protein
VRLAAGSGAPYTTDVERDSDHADFGRQPFVVPLDAIPPDGLRLEVYDADDGETPELIGAVRLQRGELVAAVGRAPLTKSDPLAAFEIVVTPYANSEPMTVSMPASLGTETALTPVLAGEVIRVRASGEYRVGSYFNSPVGPSGYPGGGPTGYNFGSEPLKSAPHACAFFLVGDEKRFATLATPGGAVITPVGGPLIVGINDNDPSNNSGNVAFTIERRLPSSSEWQVHRLVD